MNNLDNKLISDFVGEKTAKLREFLPDVKPQTLTDARRREILRLLHTIKGTARAFGLTDSSREAHRLETSLENLRDDDSQDSAESFWSLQDGIRKLVDLLLKGEIYSSKHATGEKQQSGSSIELDSLEIIPERFVSRLSVQEKTSLAVELKKGRSVIVVEAAIGQSKFQTEFIKLRNQLSGLGDIIATVPTDSTDGQAFRFIVVSNLTQEKAEEISRGVGAKLLFFFDPSANEFVLLDDVFRNAVLAGERFASEQRVKVQFEISASQQKLSMQRGRKISDALIHLIQNSVTHGIKKTGRISLEASESKNGTSIFITDDGRGIDLKRVRNAAQKMRLVRDGESVSDSEIAQFVFSYGLTTSERLSEFSGRGIGLNAVKALVEEMRGEVSLHPNPEGGTVVEIFLPDEN